MNRLGISVAIGALIAVIALSSRPVGAAVRSAVVLSARPTITEQSYSGTLQSRRHLVLTLRLRTGKLAYVDATQAYLNKKVTASLAIGESVVARGGVFAGVMIATSVAPATANALSWPADR
jgi:hypothetical protein